METNPNTIDPPARARAARPAAGTPRPPSPNFLRSFPSTLALVRVASPQWAPWCPRHSPRALPTQAPPPGTPQWGTGRRCGCAEPPPAHAARSSARLRHPKRSPGPRRPRKGPRAAVRLAPYAVRAAHWRQCCAARSAKKSNQLAAAQRSLPTQPLPSPRAQLRAHYIS